MLSKYLRRGVVVVPVVTVTIIIAALFLNKQSRKNGRIDPDDALLVSVCNNDARGVEKAIKEGGDVDYLERYGPKFNALASLISICPVRLHRTTGVKEYDYTRVMDLLVQNGAALSGLDEETYSPLFWAAVFENEESFDYLVQHGADINARLHGKTALEWAIELGEDKTGEFLRSKGAEEPETVTPSPSSNVSP